MAVIGAVEGQEHGRTGNPVVDLILWRDVCEEVWRDVHDVSLLADVWSCTLLGCVPYLLPFF